MVILTNELKCMESTGTGGCISLMTRISGKILKKLCTKNTSFQVYSLDKKYIFSLPNGPVFILTRIEQYNFFSIQWFFDTFKII